MFLSNEDKGKIKGNPKDLYEHYKSVVSLLVENDILTEPEKTVAENPIRILGIRMFCTKEDALRLLKDERIEDMHIEDAKMSRFE